MSVPQVRRPGSAAPQPLAARVYARLALGGFHSGAELARSLHVSRSGNWKATVSLRDLGVVLHAVRNRGYRLPAACGALDAAQIRAALDPQLSGRIRRLEALWSVPSTNAALLARNDLPTGLADVMLAEYQSSGRGRRGRPWLAPPGGAVAGAQRSDGPGCELLSVYPGGNDTDVVSIHVVQLRQRRGFGLARGHQAIGPAHDHALDSRSLGIERQPYLRFKASQGVRGVHPGDRPALSDPGAHEAAQPVVGMNEPVGAPFRRGVGEQSAGELREMCEHF